MPKRRWVRAALVLAGIAAGQVVLYGPSLAGRTVLLPVDLLAQPRWYLPQTAAAGIVPHNVVLSDPVLQYEVQRQFAAAEIRAGRLPLWNPDNFAGSPIVDSYSPFRLLSYLVSAPIWLAWIQLLKSLVAGAGAFVFFRRVLAVGYWPAAVGAICYPVTGFFVLWQSYPLSATVAWLPWLLLATDRAVRRPAGWGPPALATMTCVVIASELDLAGQMLIASGVYALWAAFDELGRRRRAGASDRKLAVLKPLAATAAAWVLGCMLAAPYWLPLTEYLLSGSRVSERVGGTEERPPVGLTALPQMIFPEIYGSWQKGDVRLIGANRPESSAAAYTGLLATLFLAPLALSSRRHRSRVVLCSILGLLGLGWALNVPGLVQLLRLPGLNLMSHNRFVFVASFAILCLAVIGWTRLRRSAFEQRRWVAIPAALLALVAIWGSYRSIYLPEPLATQIERYMDTGQPVLNVTDGAELERIRHRFAGKYREVAARSVLVGLFWLAFRRGLERRRWFLPVIGVLLLADLLEAGYGWSPQCDPDLYYPEIEVLARLADAPDGRVLGIDCLPPNLNRRYRLREVRGYDAVDPARLIELLDAVRDPVSPVPDYARSMWLRPRTLEPSGDGVRLPAVFDLLGVRYLIFRGSPPEDMTATMAGDDYWVAENRRALPRAFVPRRTRVVAGSSQRLALLAAPDFDPRAVAYVETDLDLAGESRGTARIVEEIPNRVTVALELETPGLVVLSDLWHPGWRATLDGEPVDVLLANHALRGVVAPASASRLTFSYRPASLMLGIKLMFVALLAWAVWCWRASRGAALRPGHDRRDHEQGNA